jgi:hypothetical protein
MKRMLILLSLTLLASTARAQLAPGSTPPPDDQIPMGNVSELPRALGFTVLRQEAVIGFRGHRIQRYHLSAPYPASALRLKEMQSESKYFGGGYRLIGWAHQFEGDKWWFRLQTPAGESLSFWLELDEGGGTLLCLDTFVEYGGPAIQSRRPYLGSDLGPIP